MNWEDGLKLKRLMISTDTFCRNFFDEGGALDLWNEVGARVANEMAEKGQVSTVGNDQSTTADLRQPNPEPGGHRQGDTLLERAPIAQEPSAGSGGQDQCDAHRPDAPAVQQPTPGEASHEIIDAHFLDAHPVRELDPGRRDQIGSDTRRLLVSASREPIASEEARITVPAKAVAHMPPAREPSEADRASMEKSANIAYFQMIKLRGKAWTVYRFKDLAKVRAVNMHETIVINAVIDWGRKNRISDERLVWTSIPQREMRAIIKTAEGSVRGHADLIIGQPKKKGHRHG